VRAGDGMATVLGYEYLPSAAPTLTPTVSSQPTPQPTAQPSDHPSGQPSSQPSDQPSNMPSKQPNDQPSGQPTLAPTATIATTAPLTEASPIRRKLPPITELYDRANTPVARHLPSARSTTASADEIKSKVNKVREKMAAMRGEL
jgi:hypothetical protein